MKKAISFFEIAFFLVRTGSGPGSPRGQPAWGGGCDRVSIDCRNRVSVTTTRSLPLPVLTSKTLLAVLSVDLTSTPLSYCLLRSHFKKANLNRVRRREKRNDQPGPRAGFETGATQSCQRVIEIGRQRDRIHF